MWISCKTTGNIFVSVLQINWQGINLSWWLISIKLYVQYKIGFLQQPVSLIKSIVFIASILLSRLRQVHSQTSLALFRFISKGVHLLHLFWQKCTCLILGQLQAQIFTFSSSFFVTYCMDWNDCYKKHLKRYIRIISINCTIWCVPQLCVCHRYFH